MSDPQAQHLVKLERHYWRDFWNEQARHSGSDYALNRGTNIRLNELEQRELQQFLKAVTPCSSDVVLDAGCGSGRNISVLSPLVGAIVGMDYSEQMIERAKERVAAEKLSNVTLIQGDVTSLQFSDNTFDKVICASVLQYLDDADCAQALHEMVRVCKPGGRLILHVKNGTSLYGLSLKLLRPIARLVAKKMKPEFYRSRAWHERTLTREATRILDHDGFGIFTFVPLPQRVVSRLLQCELRCGGPAFLKRFAVNYKLTALVEKSSG
jgi:Methylase involved in ubiquinone/menaquinone biosynthesis